MVNIAEPTRRAALVLHALSVNDREWILRRLPGRSQAMLRDLLRELAQLGIPADRELLASFGMHGQAAHETALPDEQGDVSVARLCRIVAGADPARLAVLLREEPPQLIASFIQLYDWPWREQFIQQLGPLRRKQVGELLMTSAGSQFPPRERAANRYLLNAIIARFGDDGSIATGRGRAQGRQPRLNNWLARLPAPLRRRRTA